ncbi:hypothetical protein [Streptomyces sp. NBC_00986]|uniref:hypothetical protein n=1 Tax=Streptomyces sp. NBC_00986 TaxID=2903702 RepID=UPI003866D409|nr:hypothetical protein OG504_45195 [Streptomyces sp. NBC_00986]
MSDYRAVQSAVRVEKFRVWFAWASGNVIMFFIARGTQHIHIVSVVTQALFVALFLLLTFTAIRMSNAYNRKAAAARREVLGDDL